MIGARFYVLAGVIAFLVGLATMAYVKGKSDGRVEQLGETVRAYEKRAKIDAKVSTSSRFDLCVQLGGLPDQCAELRGMGKTAAAQ